MANIFVNLPLAQRDECVDTIVDGVLATDIARNFELSSQIQSKLRNKDFKLPCKKLDERRMCSMALLKMSDISNPMKPFETARWWADVVLKEFHAQGDLEVVNMPISPLCNPNRNPNPNPNVRLLLVCLSRLCVIAPLGTWRQVRLGSLSLWFDLSTIYARSSLKAHSHMKMTNLQPEPNANARPRSHLGHLRRKSLDLGRAEGE